MPRSHPSLTTKIVFRHQITRKMNLRVKKLLRKSPLSSQIWKLSWKETVNKLRSTPILQIWNNGKRRKDSMRTPKFSSSRVAMDFWRSHSEREAGWKIRTIHLLASICSGPWNQKILITMHWTTISWSTTSQKLQQSLPKLAWCTILRTLFGSTILILKPFTLGAMIWLCRKNKKILPKSTWPSRQSAIWRNM